MRFGLALGLALCSLALASSSVLADEPRARASDLDCSNFAYQEDAQSYFISRGGPSQDPDRLDADHDGQACESLAHRGSSTLTTPPPAQPLDSDYDRVPSASDACPTAYRNVANGCPDVDGDGVADDTDACKYEAGAQPNGCPAPPPRRRETMRRARILSVIDGDTVKVRLASGKRITVRMIGVDTPETMKPGTPVECGGRQATANMKRLARSAGAGVV
jgi:hypothetical protein